MRILSSISYFFIIHLLFEFSLEVKAQDLEGFLYPPIFRIDDHGSLVLQKRAAADLPTKYEAEIEISFPDLSMAMNITDFLQKNLYNLSLGDLTTISGAEILPACNLSGPVATCSCSKGYECIGTLGPCTDTGCTCYTTLSQQRYCRLKPNITVSPAKLFSGDTGTITCNFTDVTGVSWSRNSLIITNNSKYSTSSTTQGSYQLRIKDLENSDSGTYTCTGTLDGTSQSLSISISISNVDINPSRNIDTFCDGTKWSISCCSDDILLFNVTWQAEDAPGDQSSNSSCSIYTLTADSSRCSSSQPKKFTCNFIRNEGARASSVITINYITKANISITRVSPISAGKALDIICTTNVTVTKIELAKDSASNVRASASSTSRVTFPISSTTPDWSGIFICTAYQSTLSSSQNISVEVVALPQGDSIQVFPLQSYVKCGEQAELKCCVLNQNYSIYFRNNTVITPGKPSGYQGSLSCFIYSQSVECIPNAVSSVYCVVTNKLSDNAISKDAMTISLLIGKTTCSAEDNRPETPIGSNYSLPCKDRDQTQLGNIIYPCSDGGWGQEINLCYSAQIFSALQNAQNLVNGPDVQQNLPGFLENITAIAKGEKQNIGNSSKNIEFMVNIISTVANTNVTVSEPMMKNLIQTVDIVVNNITSWGEASNQSSTVLKSVESFAKNLQFNDTFSSTNDNTSNIQVFGKVVKGDTGYYGNFSLAGLNSNVMIKNGSLPGDSNTVVTIAYSTMKDLLPQNKTKKVNALVMSTVINNSSSIDSNVFNITMTFKKSNSTLIEPDCVWLDLDHQYWTNSGCIALDVGGDKEMVKCSCNHLTSFSILMGDHNAPFLTIITYVGVSISIASLVITLMIEAVVWRSVIKNKTSYMRHVCLVNIAVTLLIADIWFMIGAALEKYPTSDACTAVAFLTFYFYLSLFFWMLVLGLILFYRLIYLLHDMSRRIMMIIAFCLGYGCPLLIAIITVAATAPSRTFTSGKFCWLSYQPVTFLAFLIPALTIVLINVIILIVVIVKLLRPGIGERHGHEEKQTFVVIAKSIAVLTPLLGSTWILGLVVATEPSNDVVHGIFAALNSFQGLFILISTVLLDRNVRKIVRSSISNSYWSTLRTKVQTTSTNSSASSKPYRKKLFGKGGGYDLYSAQSSTNDNSTNSYSVLA